MALYCLQNARAPEQQARMRALEQAGVCLFCPDGLAAYGSHAKPVVETACWLAVDNDFPYVGARRHLLLIPRTHVVDLGELDSAARTDFWAALESVRAATGADDYGVGIRSGDCAATGGTIAHLHVHFLVPDPDAVDQPLRMRFSGRSGLIR
jgi:diadenosine tetraphosphate (Ap4A) HIT family hydrolase